MTLANSHVLVTRPQGQAAGLMAAISALGAKVVHYPLMAITALDENDLPRRQACRRLVMALDQYQHVICVSTNAVHFGLGWIEQFWPQLPVGIQWYGIGKATIEKMQTAGLTVANTGSKQGTMDSEQLLREPCLQQLANQKVLILRGVGGRAYMGQQLSQRGAVVDYAECYQRPIVKRPEGELLQLMSSENISSLCITSGENLQHFCTLLGENHLPKFKQMLIVVPGQRVAAIAAERGFKKISIAENASDASMVTALERALTT